MTKDVTINPMRSYKSHKMSKASNCFLQNPFPTRIIVNGISYNTVYTEKKITSGSDILQEVFYQVFYLVKVWVPCLYTVTCEPV